MNFDGGTGYVISAIVGSVVMWILGRIDKGQDRSHGSVQDLDGRLTALERQHLEYKAYVAENYHKQDAQREFEKAVFTKLDDIVKLINTKADK